MSTRGSPPAPVVALGLFSTLPMPTVQVIDPRLAGRAIAWFPVVGLLLGGIAGVAAWCVGWLGGTLLGGVAGVAILTWLTGALHLDGLADTADGLGSRKPAAEALAIMRRSDIGPMGVIAVVLVLLADVAAVARLTEMGTLGGPAALLAGAVLSRVAIVLATTSTHHGASEQGFGALFDGVTRRSTAVLWMIGAVVLGASAGWLVDRGDGALAFGAGAVASLVVARLWLAHVARRLGGLTGDTFGSLIEITMLTFLAVSALTFGALAL